MIPLSELPGRTYELPAPGAPVGVVETSPQAEAAVEWLIAHGRTASRGMPDDRPRRLWRLWEPNGLLMEAIDNRAPGRALDLGCGIGRDAVALAACGWEVTAVDRLPDAIERGRDLERRYAGGGPPIDWRVGEASEVDCVGFDLVAMFFFLDRARLAAAIAGLRSGGAVVVETFTTLHRERHGRPRGDLALEPGELTNLAAGLRVQLHDESWRGDRHTARLWATRMD